MKGILIAGCYLFCIHSWTMECTNTLTSEVASKLKSDQTLILVKFKKLMAPKERFIDLDLGRKMIVNHYSYPVYYYQSLIESDSQFNTTRYVYLLSPNSCRIIKRGSIVMN